MQNILNYLIDSEISKLKNGRNQFFQRRFDYAGNLFWKDLKGHFSCVNSIEFSNAESQHMISAGDDMRILLWNINNDILNDGSVKSQPYVFRTQHNSNIFTLAWDNENKNIFSGANDHQVIVHDAKTGQVVDIFLHEAAVYCLSVNPKQSQIFATACESGHVSMFDMRLSSSDPIILASSARGSTSSSFFASSSNVSSAFHSCCFNPVESNIIAVANEVSGISVIDIRMKSILLRYRQASVYASTDSADNTTAPTPSKHPSPSSKKSDFKQNAMNVRFNQYGTQLAALRHRLRPVLYLLNEPTPIYTFDHENFSNSCTLKSACFAGDQDQYFVSGSDDFNVYVWKIPQTSYTGLDDSDESESPISQPVVNSAPRTTHISNAHLKLSSHRSIVNQVRYNYKYHMLASSGVEKIVKVWTPFKAPGCTNGGLLGKDEEYVPKRKLYTTRDLFALRWDADIDSSSISSSGSSSLSLNSGSLNSGSNPYSMSSDLNSSSSSTYYESESDHTGESSTTRAESSSAESSENLSHRSGGSGTSTTLTDPLDVAAANYEPVIRNVMAVPEASESLEEDRVMIAFFDSLVRRQQAKNREASRSFLRKLKRRNQRRHSPLLYDDDDDTVNSNDDLSIIDEDPAEDDDDLTDYSLTDLSTSSSDASSLSSTSSSSSSLTESSDSSSVSSSDDSTVKLSRNKKKARHIQASSSELDEEVEDCNEDSSDISSIETGSSTTLSDLNEPDLNLISADSQASRNRERNKQSKSNIALRNRIRNFRHRLSLNLTQEGDYLTVLDSLQVQRGDSTSSAQAQGDEPPEASTSAGPRTSTDQDPQDPDTKIFSDLDTSKESNDDHSPIANLDQTSSNLANPINQPGTSRNLALKGLNEKKRKIELNRDDEDDVKEPSSSAATSSADQELTKSESTGSLFRKSKKKRNNDEPN